MEILNNPYENKTIEGIERMLLAIMLTDSQTVPLVISRLEPKHFTKPEYKALYRKIFEYYQAKNSLDHNLLITFIGNEKDKAINNPSELIMSLLPYYTNSYDVEEYVEIILMESTIRELRSFGRKLEEVNVDYYSYDDDLWNIQKEFLNIINSRSSSSITTAKDVTRLFIDKITRVKENLGKMTGTTTGFRSVDEFTNGFQPGELIILAARPSIGKTALAINMLVSAAKECKENECVVIFSLEMSSEQLMERMVSSETNINSNAFKKGTWAQDDEFIIHECMKKIEKLPIHFDDSSNLSILEIQTKLKQISAQKKIKLVVVDYLQLISGIKGVGVNRQIEVAQISRTLKSLARDIETPIIAVAQLSRKIEERRGNDKKSKPILSDLRESGSIEQDADIVIFLNYDRDEVDEKSASNNSKQYLQTVVVDFIIAKNRSGSTGELKLLFEKQYGRYSDFNDF